MNIHTWIILILCVILSFALFMDHSIEGMYAPYGPNTTTYYEPGTYTYDTPTFRPNQETGEYTSLSTGGSQVGIINTLPYDRNDICQLYASDPIGLENACKKLEKGACASTSCCILLGGEKCVRGDAYGPTLRNHYSDILVRRRDFHEYKGQCYGNCSRV
jgi:hypothetical protein